jgi:hypothetical protein
VTYAEGSTGPGFSRKGEPGSPIIALSIAITRRELLDTGTRLSMFLIDETSAASKSQLLDSRDP